MSGCKERNASDWMEGPTTPGLELKAEGCTGADGGRDPLPSTSAGSVAILGPAHVESQQMMMIKCLWFESSYIVKEMLCVRVGNYLMI